MYERSHVLGYRRKLSEVQPFLILASSHTVFISITRAHKANYNFRGSGNLPLLLTHNGVYRLVC